MTSSVPEFKCYVTDVRVPGPSLYGVSVDGEPIADYLLESVAVLIAAAPKMLKALCEIDRLATTEERYEQGRVAREALTEVVGWKVVYGDTPV